MPRGDFNVSMLILSLKAKEPMNRALWFISPYSLVHIPLLFMSVYGNQLHGAANVASVSNQASVDRVAFRIPLAGYLNEL